MAFQSALLSSYPAFSASSETFTPRSSSGSKNSHFTSRSNLLTASDIERIKGDLRVIEMLVQKDEQISRNIGEPASILRNHSIEAEKQLVADALASAMTAEPFERECIDQATPPDDDDDCEAALFGTGLGTAEQALPAASREPARDPSGQSRHTRLQRTRARPSPRCVLSLEDRASMPQTSRPGSRRVADEPGARRIHGPRVDLGARRPR